jgi:hypothetical protein
MKAIEWFVPRNQNNERTDNAHTIEIMINAGAGLEF